MVRLQTDTSSLYRSVADSFLKISLISSGVVALPAIKVTSDIEPTSTGERMTTSSNFPSYRGKALVVAIAAPVAAGPGLPPLPVPF
jgi:hypothetical protein